MKAPLTPRKTARAFTLIELLVVIAIIAILAALIFPVISRIVKQAKVKQAQLEVNDIANAIRRYESTYNKYPVATDVMTSSLISKDDFTFGGDFFAGAIIGSPGLKLTNDQVIAVLMALDKNPRTGVATVNSGHEKNTQKIKFLDPPTADDSTRPGVGPDLVYRDPWGNPYIISLDLNYDGKCRGEFYKLATVSQQNGSAGHNGLNNSQVAIDPDRFEYNGGVMVWSMGPDKQVDAAAAKANEGFNKDNVLSWRQ